MPGSIEPSDAMPTAPSNWSGGKFAAVASLVFRNQSEVEYFGAYPWLCGRRHEDLGGGEVAHDQHVRDALETEPGGDVRRLGDHGGEVAVVVAEDDLAGPLRLESGAEHVDDGGLGGGALVAQDADRRPRAGTTAWHRGHGPR